MPPCAVWIVAGLALLGIVVFITWLAIDNDGGPRLPPHGGMGV